jgi:mono/diheme cytochrome c family protein
MMQALRAIVIAAVILAAAGSARVVVVDAQAPAGNAPNGEAAYAKTGCDGCHGPQGGGSAIAPSLVTSTLSIKDFIAQVRQPRGAMPPFSVQALSDASLTDIYAFVRQKPRSQAPAAPAPATQPPAAAPKGRVEVGAKLFGTIGCYQCHANEGQGGTQGPRIGPNPIPFARFSSYVRRPTGDMPPYTAVVLSDQDMADIYAFLEARPKPPAVNSIPLLAP